MKINLNWLTDYVDLKVKEDELLNRINTQLGEIDGICDLAEKYSSATIVKIKKVSRHAKTPGLSVCLIDDRGVVKDVARQDGYVQVVCGAKNVIEGMLVVWLPPGSILPGSYADSQPVVLKEKLIGNVLSWGMLASAQELDISSESDEILEISPGFCPFDLSVQPNQNLIGRPFSQVFGLQTKVINIENKMFTHRPDCFGLLGVAREIAAITESPFKPADWYEEFKTNPHLDGELDFNLAIESKELCPRIMAKVFANVSVQDSDLKLQTRLSSVGFKPVNNIVDLTNYVMYVSGQPTHAFDYDCLLEHSHNDKMPLNLIVRRSQPTEKLKLINGKELDFASQPALVIATDKKPVALAGIMGGAETEVSRQTTRILLECANFDMYDLRRTSMFYGLSSEAGTRFTKGQSLEQIPTISYYLANILSRRCQAKFLGMREFNPESSRSRSLTVSPDFISRRLGKKIPAEDITSLMQKVGFEVSTQEDSLQIEIPFWRTDIEIAEDILEEVGRLSPGGYQLLEPVLPWRQLSVGNLDPELDIKRKIRLSLSGQGANETVGYSFVSTKFLNSVNQDESKSFHLNNPLNPQLQAYRQSLTPSLISQAEVNRKQGKKDFVLFELGSVHQKDQKYLDENRIPLDLPRLALVGHSSLFPPGEVFYRCRRYLDLLAKTLGKVFSYEVYELGSDLDHPLSQPYDQSQKAIVKLGNKYLGLIGLLNGSGTLAGFELHLQTLLSPQDDVSRYKPLGDYPFSHQDLTLQFKLEVPYAEIIKSLEKELEVWRAKYNLTLEFLGIFQPEEKQVKNVSFRIRANSVYGTIKKEELSHIVAQLSKIAKAVH